MIVVGDYSILMITMTGIRNKNNYIVRTYKEELEYEIRTVLLNPKFVEALIHSSGGINSYASRYQNFYASLVMSGDKLNKHLGDQLADEALYIASQANDATLAPAAQSTLAWQIYMADQGLWEGDPSKVRDLVDKYMDSVNKYGVACCHHTCKNLAFNAKLIQMSSLTPAQKQKFAEILAQATKTEPLYKMDEELDQQGSEGNTGNGAESGEEGDQNANALSNSTSQQSQSDGSNSGGQTAVGNEPSTQGDAKSAADSDSSQDASSGGTGEGGLKSYELSEKSASKSASATESSMPIFVIAAVIALIAIFLVGYIKDQDDEFDDY